MVAHLLCALMEYIRHFDLLKAFGYIERIVKSEKIKRKRPILHYTCAICSEMPSYISTMICTVPRDGREEQGQAWSSGAQVSDGLTVKPLLSYYSGYNLNISFDNPKYLADSDLITFRLKWFIPGTFVEPLYRKTRRIDIFTTQS